MNKLKYSLIVLAMAVFLPSLPASAATTSPMAGMVVKGSGPSVYYVTKSGDRLVFPDEATYKSWYPDFRNVITVPDWQLNAAPLSGNVPMKPGTKIIKAKGDNRVYAVARYGTARWLSSPSAAAVIYGASWNQRVVEVSPATLAEYVKGADIAGPDQYWWMREMNSVKTIDDNYDASLNGMRRLASTSVSPNTQLTLKAIVVNDGSNGRFNATDSEAKLFVEATPVVSGKAYGFKAGDYTVYHNPDRLQGYEVSSWGGDCSAWGTVALRDGDKKTCTITYRYTAAASKDPVLTMRVNVQNDFRGMLMPDDFTLLVGSDRVKSGEARAYAPGWYKVRSLNGNKDYTPMGWSGANCPLEDDGAIQLKRGQNYDCTYTWQYVKPGDFRPTMGSLVLGAIVQNGTLKASDVKLFLEGRQVSAAQLLDVDPRGYTVYFSAPSNYVGTWSGDCSTAGHVQAEVLKHKACTVVLKLK